MRYNEVKQQRDSAAQAITKKNSELAQARSQLESNAVNISSIKQNHEATVSNAKNAAYKSYVDKLVAEHDARLQDCVAKVNKLTGIYQEQLAKITKESVETRLGVDKHLSANVKESTKRLKTVIEELVGSDFVCKISESLEQDSCIVTEDEIDSYIDYFDATADSLKRLNILSRFLPVDFLQRKLQKASLSNFNFQTKQVLIIGASLLGILILTANYTLPIYLGLCSLTAGLNTARALLINKSLKAHKIVLDNLGLIEERISKQVEAEVEKEKNALSIDYNTAKGKYQAKIDEIKSDMNKVIIDASKSFTFTEDEASKRSYATMLQSAIDKDEADKRTVERLQTELNDLQSELKSAEELLQKALGSLQGEYLNYGTAGTSFLFDNAFLLDIVNGKPVIYKHNRESNLYIYTEMSDVISFIQLIMLQLRCRISPFALNLVYYDTVYAGRDIQAFIDDKHNLPIEIAINSEQIADSLHSLVQKRDKRIAMLRTVTNIEDYNREMINMDSVPESYYFVFMTNVDSGLQNTAEFKSLIATGGKVGIFIFNFVQKDSLQKDKSVFETQLDHYGSVYTIADGNLQRKAVSFVRERMLT